MEQDVLILSPEKTILSFRLAPLGARISAHILDISIVFATLIASAIVLGNTVGRIDEHLSMGAMIFLSFAEPLAYFVLLEGLWNGQTVGKKMMNLRVRMADGKPITIVGAIGRNFLRPADILPGTYFVGMLAIFTNSRAQRLGDLVAGTMVCHESRPEPLFAITPHSAGVHALEDYVGSLRGMTLEEYNALRRFADRFPELAPDIQKKLVAEVWDPLAKRRAIPIYPNVHPIYLAEAVVMKYGREHGLI